jgi:4-aminobutyrate aminotransferase
MQPHVPALHLRASMQVELVDRLLGVCPPHLSRFFFCNSGAEAVDNAIKVARVATGRPNVIAFDVRT